MRKALRFSPKIALAVVALVFSPAWAATITEEFLTNTHKDAATTAIWNTSLGTAHPTLEAINFNGAAVHALDVGDGRDGAFVPSRYSEFGTIVGNTLTLNSSELQVSEFLLEDPWIIEAPAGAALVIRSLSDVIIRGQIWCQGHAAVGATGGEGRCGGTRGGDGVAAGLQGNDGADSTAPVTGGHGGAAAAVARGGGGGGSWSLASPAADGLGFVNTGAPNDPGEHGASTTDPEFTVLAGGAGGGAGGGGTVGMTGAGGGGGGVVVINAVRNLELGSATDPLVGFILASGGDGSDPTNDGGAGAGGGGGGIKVLVGGSVRIYSNSGVAGAQAVGGRNTVPAPTGAAGGPGRSWFSSRVGQFFGPGFYDPTEEITFSSGDVIYSATAQSAVSKPFDLANRLADVVSIVKSPTNADFTLQWAGSTDNFVSDDTGWSTDVTVLRAKRFVRFRANTSAFAGTPVHLDSVTVNYAPGTRDQFDFVATGCARVGSRRPSTPGANALNLFFLCLPLGLLVYLKWEADGYESAQD